MEVKRLIDVIGKPKTKLIIESEKGIKPVSPGVFVDVLISQTQLSTYVKYYDSASSFYLYSSKLGIWQQVSLISIDAFLTELLVDLGIRRYLPLPEKYVSTARNTLRIDPKIFKRDLRPKNNNLICLTNGVMNLSLSKFHIHSPSHNVFSRVEYPYDSEQQCPRWLSFLDRFTSREAERVEFLRAWLWALINRYTGAQKFLSLVGPGASGKSTFALVAVALMGKESSLTTTLKELASNPFLVSNILGKGLLLISDSEAYHGDLAVLKQLVGGDSLGGQIKFKQESVEVVLEGNILIVSNFPLSSKDSSTGLIRRILYFKAEAIVPTEEREALITKTSSGFEGPLARELPGIFNWVLGIGKERAQELLKCPERACPSLFSMFKTGQIQVNPLASWVEEELISGQGAYVGVHMEMGLKGDHEVGRRKPLYPAYERWCKRIGYLPFSSRRFSNDLLYLLQDKGYLVSRVHKREGTYIEGVELNPIVFSSDYRYGAPIIEVDVPSSTQEGVNSEGVNSEGANLEGVKSFKVREDVTSRYKDKLGKTPLKEKINQIARSIILSSEEIMERLLPAFSHPSEEYKGILSTQILKAVRTLKTFGIVPYTYVPLGASPRIRPISYKDSLNSVKRLIREIYLETIGQALEPEGYCIIDVDLASCYTTILLGLFPNELPSVYAAISQGSIWDHLQREFIARGHGDSYDKPSVKVATHSCLFRGGNNAMIKGIMESERKNIGITENEFKALPDFKERYERSVQVVQALQKTDIILDLRNTAEAVFTLYKDDFLQGPSGHSYRVTESNFPSVYSSFLQSYEIVLIAEASLRLIESKKTKAEIIGHFHDGNLWVVPKGEEETFISSLKQNVTDVGSCLGLSFPQRLEVKTIYPQKNQG